MADDNKIQKAADAIVSLFADGIRLSPDVLHYMNSVAGVQNAAEMRPLLAEPDDCDGQSLCELIFFPDVAQQVRIEPLLENETFDPADVDGLIQRLARTDVQTTLAFPEDADNCRIPVPPYALSQFIRRLHIDREIAPPVAEAISAQIESRATALWLRVKLRNARFAFSAHFSSFICAILANISETEPEFSDMFAFACDSLEEIGPETDIYLALMDRKRHCGEMIQKARQSEKNLRELPVEALIMKGVNIPCISVDDARRRIDIIDRISIAVFGRTELTENLMAEAHQPMDLGLFNRHTDIDRVIKILS